MSIETITLHVFSMCTDGAASHADNKVGVTDRHFDFTIVTFVNIRSAAMRCTEHL